MFDELIASLVRVCLRTWWESVSAIFAKRRMPGHSQHFSSEFHQSAAAAPAGCCFIISHPLLHFLRRGLRFVRPGHPGIAIRVDNRAASDFPRTYPLSVLDWYRPAWSLSRPRCRRSRHIYTVWRGRRRYFSLRLPIAGFSGPGISVVPRRVSSVHRFSVRAVHDASFRKTKGFLIKAHGGRDIAHGEGSGHSA
jgi:hypothetical protein